MVEGVQELKQDLEFNRTLIFKTLSVKIDVVDYDDGERYKDELKGCLLRILDPQGKVITEWTSPGLSMKGKTWKNTTPRKEGGGSVIIR